MSNAETPAENTGGTAATPIARALAELPDKTRVHLLAKLLGTSSREVLAALAQLGHTARSPQSGVSKDVALRVAEELGFVETEPPDGQEQSDTDATQTDITQTVEPAEAPAADAGDEPAADPAAAPNATEEPVAEGAATEEPEKDQDPEKDPEKDVVADSAESKKDEETAEEDPRGVRSESSEQAGATESPQGAPVVEPAETGGTPSATTPTGMAPPVTAPVLIPPVPPVQSTQPEPRPEIPHTPVFAAPSPLFLPPEPIASPPAAAKGEAGTDASGSGSDSRQTHDHSGDGGSSDGTRRRRRRGRRGRGRGKGGEDHTTTSSTSTATTTDTAASTATEAADSTGTAEGEQQAKPGAENTDESSTSVASDTDGNVGGGGESSTQQEEGDTERGAAQSSETETTTTRRRRRRRRRRSGDDDTLETTTSADDPPNTVVHVRDGKPAEEKETKAEDGVRSVRGSTRLEAKRQRRRDGREAGRRRAPILSEAEFLARRESVERTMVVAERGDSTQIGVLEDGVLVEHFVTSSDSGSIVGNVYLGRVQNVLPSMEAAFIDIGRGRNAVLYAGEVNWDAAGLEGKARKIEQALTTGDTCSCRSPRTPSGTRAPG